MKGSSRKYSSALTVLLEQKLQTIFSKLDKTKTGLINAEALSDALSKWGKYSNSLRTQPLSLFALVPLPLLLPLLLFLIL
jgi:hypothetical protein